MGFLLVMKAEFMRSLIIMRRYWFATFTGIILGYLTLLGLIFAFRQNQEMAAQWATEKALGFIIGMFAFGVIGLFTNGLQGMARTGELEQLCMSPHGLVINFLARSAVSSISTILSSAIMIWLIAYTIGDKLYADFAPTVLLLLLTYVNLIGFGFMVGGLVLVFKQTGQVAIILRLILLGLAVSASENVERWAWPLRWIAHVMPITDAAICLKLVIVQGESMSIVTHSSFYFLLVSCAIWTFIGICVFKFMENVSRDRGTLGAY